MVAGIGLASLGTQHVIGRRHFRDDNVGRFLQLQRSSGVLLRGDGSILALHPRECGAVNHNEFAAQWNAERFLFADPVWLGRHWLSHLEHLQRISSHWIEPKFIDRSDHRYSHHGGLLQLHGPSDGFA